MRCVAVSHRPESRVRAAILILVVDGPKWRRGMPVLSSDSVDDAEARGDPWSRRMGRPSKRAGRSRSAAPAAGDERAPNERVRIFVGVPGGLDVFPLGRDEGMPGRFASSANTAVSPTSKRRQRGRSSNEPRCYAKNGRPDFVISGRPHLFGGASKPGAFVWATRESSTRSERSDRANSASGPRLTCAARLDRQIKSFSVGPTPPGPLVVRSRFRLL